MPEFVGTGLALSSGGLSEAAQVADIGLPLIWAVLSVETSGCGFLPDRRPKILFERHIFHDLTNGRFDNRDPDISHPTAGGYGAGGAHQYDRLAAAMRFDREAALQSASWGMGQIMGENFEAAGFSKIEDMVAAMVQSEDDQLLAGARFMLANGMNEPLRHHHWAGFARRYNGPTTQPKIMTASCTRFISAMPTAICPTSGSARRRSISATTDFREGLITWRWMALSAAPPKRRSDSSSNRPACPRRVSSMMS